MLFRHRTALDLADLAQHLLDLGQAIGTESDGAVLVDDDHRRPAVGADPAGAAEPPRLDRQRVVEQEELKSQLGPEGPQLVGPVGRDPEDDGVQLLEGLQASIEGLQHRIGGFVAGRPEEEKGDVEVTLEVAEPDPGALVGRERESRRGTARWQGLLAQGLPDGAEHGHAGSYDGVALRAGRGSSRAAKIRGPRTRGGTPGDPAARTPALSATKHAVARGRVRAPASGYLFGLQDRTLQHQVALPASLKDAQHAPSLGLQLTAGRERAQGGADTGNGPSQALAQADGGTAENHGA